MKSRLTVHCACGHRFEHVDIDPNAHLPHGATTGFSFSPPIVCPACKRECDPIDDVEEFEVIPGPPPSQP